MTSLREFWKSFKRLFKEDDRVIRPDHSVDKVTNLKQDIPPVKPEEVTTTPLIRIKKDKVHIQVGLDFGTSCSKIMYRQIGRRQARVINFQHDLPNFPQYCFPSVASVNDRGHLLFGVEAAKWLLTKEWDYGLQRFKVIVAGKQNEAFRDPVTEENFNNYCGHHNLVDVLTPERVTAIYLANAMTKTRQIIEQYPEYKNVELDIAFNIGMPIDYIENNAVRLKFESAFSWAEAIERKWQTNKNNFDPLQASYDLENVAEPHNKRVFAVPEAVASMASYLMSLRRQEGLHALIDFGSGTTDVSICNLFLTFGETNSYWYAARNIPKGTIIIERLIASYLKDSYSKSLCTCSDVVNYLNMFAESPSKAKRNADVSLALNSDILKEIKSLKDSKEYYQTWGAAYKQHLTKESSWEKVEVFVCGGGARLPYIEEVFSAPWWDKLKVKYPVSRLPVPDDYRDDKSGAPFDRMTVAYGLTLPVPELEKFVLPSAAPDHTPPITRAPDRDRDDLYPK